MCESSWAPAGADGDAPEMLPVTHPISPAEASKRGRAGDVGPHRLGAALEQEQIVAGREFLVDRELDVLGCPVELLQRSAERGEGEDLVVIQAQQPEPVFGDRLRRITAPVLDALVTECAFDDRHPDLVDEEQIGCCRVVR